ncbi:hypothetical protein [Xenorhabdus bovienii]|uniref:Uncharacterized protein n=1 Tax=Xenorhabdus bovienii str. kraussei Becker Underwood TaxID=1398204 RepID=A0A077PQ39_XENBV|nr:hypothetical protein [Xenorhabdus bovienii]CDG88089.1 conserved hypothetical protein [Xenorhabdus bovienii str. feltiae France]CDG91613.1 conserved hypothetical protein [Xenorhabdus bovienii str. feltiae Florida]CDH22652.1 conserved hypothetical protein [Xenorhabdus bovienii str. kraussei Becker Underwood]
MAKKQEIVTDGLGELPTELQVNVTENLQKPQSEPALTKFPDTLPEEPEDEDVPEWVVLKGNTVQHDGVAYPENSVIYLSGEDAERLIQLGVVMRLDDLKSQLLSGNSVTVQDGVRVQQEA